ncbi:MAG TPA: hypothetical protein VNL91_10585 [Thermoanaerobaculia bacterium]|nr:hypothetical protein [Thermoanaerobaculia bacterium]
MRIRLAFVLTLLSAPAFAVAPQFWRVTTADDFLAGEIEGLAVTSRGELRSAPAVKKITSFTDPFVLSQVTAPNGDRFFGTGNEGKIYRLRGSELKLIHTAPEPEVYALAFRDGALYAGTSPNGKVYRIDPETGRASDFHDPGQAYIWALHPVGDDLLVATGVEGKLFRISPKGEGRLLFDAPETHIRSLAVRKDGTILAGGSGQGRIYAIRPDGAARALYDASMNEISAIHVDAGGIAWAAGATSVLPTSAPPRTAKPQQPAAGSGGSSSSSSQEQQKKESEQPSSKVEVSFSFEEAPGPSEGGSAELYRIHPDGFVEVARKFEREMIYAIASSPAGGIVLATGPQGRIYSFRDDEIALIGTVPEKQIVSISGSEPMVVTTTNSGAVYRLDNGRTAAAEYRSAVRDVERFSRFGQYRIEPNHVAEGSVAISFRSGNTRTPDGTWSNWSQPSTRLEGNVDAPPARYLQWKLSVVRPSDDIAIDGVSVAFINRNVAPAIEAVSVQEPAVIFISSAYPASPQVVEATNPDEHGIFSSLEPPREKEQQGKRAFRKGYRTITWRARDENGDALRYSVSFRMKGSERWLRLRDNLDETQMNFDTSQLPDGTYQLRLVASDAQDNPEMPLTDTKEGIEFQVDNSSPSISIAPEGEDVVVRVSDRLSTIGKVEYSVDAQKWLRLTPADGIADSRSETYRLKRSAVSGKFVIVRAVDAFYNVATESITIQ